MLKKFLIAVFILFCGVINSHAQFAITISATDIPSNDPHLSTEGDLVHYMVTITPTGPVTGKYNFTANVINGTIVSQQLVPTFPPQQTTPLYIDVQWDCHVTVGTINIVETFSGVSTQYNTTITSYLNSPNYCNNVQPLKQNLVYGPIHGQVSALLTVTNCNPYCNADPSPAYYYQWQIGDVPIGVFPQEPPLGFTDIPGANLSTYQPPQYFTNCIKAFRRVTKFYNNIGFAYTYYSKTAVVSNFSHLQPGTITFNNIYNNGTPSITQTPATGGMCDGYNYIYSWEISYDGGIVWGDWSYPGGIVYGPCKIRRRVDCDQQTLYSNVLDIVPPILDPGTITNNGASTVPFNTLPTITQIPAIGGVCSTPDFQYTWERSINGGVWLPFGSTVTYPTNGNIIGTCKIRRKVVCVYETKYSNELTFTMLPYTDPNFENLNFVRTNDIVIPGVHSWEQANELPTGQKLQSTTYLDGFGRPIQTVVKQGSLKQSAAGYDPDLLSSYQDLVTHVGYDGLGRTDKGYLPYATTTNLGFYKTNAEAEQKSFTNTKYGEPVNSNYTFSQVTYDGSPLNRVINSKLPGYNWNSDPNYLGISSDYDFNKLDDNIRIWDITFDAGAKPTSPGAYGDNKLTISITKDEKGKLIAEYTDLSGQTILKKVQEAASVDIRNYTGWVCTYYVYDDFGRLRYTITPEAVNHMLINGWSFGNNDDIKNGWSFYQEYDKRGRVIVKHSPDGGEVHLVYDNRDRLVLSQDANQRSKTPIAQWSYSLYDELDRNIATGLMNDGRGRAGMQSMVYNLTAINKQVEIFTGQGWETVTAYNPVAGQIPSGGNHCGSCSNNVANSLNFYDDYSRRPLSQKSQQLTLNDFASTTNPFVEQPTVADINVRMRGAATVSKVRILDDKYDNGIITDDKFLISTVYYDNKGRVVQAYSDNIKGGVDGTASLYDFAGKVLSTRGKHSMPGNEFNNMYVANTTDYDLLGRAKNTKKLYTLNPSDINNSNNYKLTSTVLLDEFGRGKTKKIGDDPLNPGTPLEIQDFTYNIQGWLTGINKDYALAQNGMNLQWQRRFGMYMGYENGDGKLLAKQWNGSITGTIWRSQGDNTQRKYDYEYDNLNRFTNAIFKQKENLSPSTPWLDNTVNLSASVEQYDLNGNIKRFKQMGIVPGTNNGIIIDDLTYTYQDKSNKLQAVVDNPAASYVAQNGVMGDFRNSNPPSTTHYDYDFNGNLKNDKNKNIEDIPTGAGIVSNFLDLPEKITIKDKSKTEYLYDAAGGKLAKKVTPNVVPTTTIPQIIITTWYMGGFIYEETNKVYALPTPSETKTELKYIVNEEGKLRIVEEGVTNSQYGVLQASIIGNVNFGLANSNKRGVWDYYLKDNLTNTRMVITEERHVQLMTCTMEGNLPPANPTPFQLEEEQEFGDNSNGGANNQVKNTRVDKQPLIEWTNNPSARVSKLIASATSTAIGPNAILKVMAGDELILSAKYFYRASGQLQHSPIGNANSILQSLVAALSGSSNVTSGVKGNIPTNQSTTLGGINNFLNQYQPPPGTSNMPRAYLNYIFFDEQFKYIGEESGAQQVDEILSPNTFIQSALAPGQLKAPKNGYVYIYLSNETNNVNVYFDDLTIMHTRGAIVEDNAYYPFGLKIQGISARAAKKEKTKQGYQGDYSEQDEESGYNEFALRFYDAQIGRWIQVDPYDVAPSMYIGMANNPANVVDVDGGEAAPPGWGRMWDGKNYSYAFYKNGILPEGWEAVPEGITSIFENGVEWGLGENGFFKLSLAPNPVLELSLDDKMRFYLNTTHDVDLGLKYGAVKNVWEGIKGLGLIASYGDPMSYINPVTVNERSKMINGMNQSSLDAQLNYFGNVPAALLGNYVKGKYNAIAKGDFFDATTAIGAIGSDVAMIAAPELMASKTSIFTTPARGGWMNGSTILGSDAATTLNASRMIPESGVHQVLLHGTGEGFIVNGGFTSAKDLARTMLQSGFEKGTKIRLISCYTGVYADGAAYQLSRYLKSPVMAPTNKVRILSGGGYEILGNGTFKTFFNTTIK